MAVMLFTSNILQANCLYIISCLMTKAKGGISKETAVLHWGGGGEILEDNLVLSTEFIS